MMPLVKKLFSSSGCDNCLWILPKARAMAQDPYSQAYWKKANIREKKKRRNEYQNAFNGNKGYPSHHDGKGKGGKHKRKTNTLAPFAEKSKEQPANQQAADLSACYTLVGRTRVWIHHGVGVKVAGTQVMRLQCRTRNGGKP